MFPWQSTRVVTVQTGSLIGPPQMLNPSALETFNTLLNQFPFGERVFAQAFSPGGTRLFSLTIRRDQRAVCCAPRAAGRPRPLSTTPVPLHKPRARHERASAMCRISGGLPSAVRRRALRSGFVSLDASLRPPLHLPRSPTADRSLNGIFHAPFGAVRLAVPTIPSCARLPQPTQILWAAP